MSDSDSQTRKIFEEFHQSAYAQFKQVVESSIEAANAAGFAGRRAADQTRVEIQKNIDKETKNQDHHYVVFQNEATGILVTLRDVESQSAEGYKAVHTSDSFEACCQYINSRLGQLVALAKDGDAMDPEKAEG